MIHRLFETHIRALDFERSRRFYEEALGLRVGWIDEKQRRVLYWVGAAGESMLGMREVPPDQVTRQHFSFEVGLDEMRSASAWLGDRGIRCFNFIDDGAYPQVFGWMPAVAIYFRDPDEHLLEFIAMLPQEPRPDIGLVSWDEWDRLHGASAMAAPDDRGAAGVSTRR
jgi:catechol 2,3-dioxygenase-like lactoylglutathione lyase family enzyme